MNSVFIRGNLTKEPELKRAGEYSVCNIDIAYNHYKKNGGDPDVSFFECHIWGKAAEYAAENLHKGDRVAVEGQIKQERWEGKDGKRNKVVLNCRSIDKLVKLEKKGDNHNNSVDDDDPF